MNGQARINLNGVEYLHIDYVDTQLKQQVETTNQIAAKWVKVDRRLKALEFALEQIIELVEENTSKAQIVAYIESVIGEG